MLFEKYVFHSPHSPQECVDLLRPHIDEGLLHFGPEPFIGRVDEDTLVVSCRFKGRNSFHTVYGARLRPADKEGRGGAVIEGRMRMTWDTLLFLACVFLVAASWFVLAGIPVLFTYAFGDPAELRPDPLIKVINPFLIVGMTCLVTAGGRYCARNEERKIVEFIQRTVCQH